MKKQILLSAVLACISVFLRQRQKEPVDYVNPFVGTTNYGTTNPGALTPHGMMSVTPFNVMGFPKGIRIKTSNGGPLHTNSIINILPALRTLILAG